MKERVAMKKFLVFIMALICCSNLITDADAFGVEYNIIGKENRDQDYYEYNGLKLTYHSGAINNFWYTGKEYIYRDIYDGYSRYRKSYDMIDWEDISETSGMKAINKLSNYTYSINYWGDKYIVFNRLHEQSGESIGEAQQGATLNRPLLILNENFELISEQEFDAPITAVSYADGRYYAETKDYSLYKNPYNFEPGKKVYVSDDAIVWNEDSNLSEAPLSSLILKGELPDDDTRYVKKVVGVAQQGDVNNIVDVTFEKKQSKYYKTVNDLYISWDAVDIVKRVFQISLDGIYWLDVDFPNLLTSRDVHPESASDSVIESVYECIGMKDKILFQTQYRLFEYSLDGLRALCENVCGTSPIYIKFSGRYLGFETPPVIEDGSTLVPIRFLFEQMGATVDWEQGTQTATISQGDKTITFTIDNTTAAVNGAPATMTVPARLINGKTMVPLRFLSENLGYTVDWDADSRTAIIE